MEIGVSEPNRRPLPRRNRENPEVSEIPSIKISRGRLEDSLDGKISLCHVDTFWADFVFMDVMGLGFVPAHSERAPRTFQPV